MKIALVSQEYPTPRKTGGIGSQTRLKARGLARRGHEVHVVTVGDDGNTFEDGVWLHRMASCDDRLTVHSEAVRWLLHSAEVGVRLSELVDDVAPDVIDFPEWAGEGYVYLLNRSEGKNVPTVVQIHGPLVMFAHAMGWPELDSDLYRIGSEMEGTCLRLADGLFSSSHCSADWCASSYGLDRARIPVLHAGVDVEHFHPRDVPKAEQPTIVFVGKIVRNKGVENLVGAACNLADDYPDLRLRMFGPYEEWLVRELNELVVERGRPDLLEILGHVPQEELPVELSRAQVFAAPSHYEGGPSFVCLEAMACAVPVVTTSGSGVIEIVNDGDNGLLVPPNDTDALAKAIDRLLDDPHEATQMGERARRFVLATGDTNKCVARIEDFYKRLVG